MTYNTILELLSIWVIIGMIQTDARVNTNYPYPVNDNPLDTLVRSSPSGKLAITWEKPEEEIEGMEHVVHYTTDQHLRFEEWKSKAVTNTNKIILKDLQPSTVYTVRLEARVKDVPLPWPVFIQATVTAEQRAIDDSPELESLQLTELNSTYFQQKLLAMDSRLERLELTMSASFGKLETLLTRLDSRMDLLEDVAKALTTGKCDLTVVHPPRTMTCRIERKQPFNV